MSQSIMQILEDLNRPPSEKVASAPSAPQGGSSVEASRAALGNSLQQLQRPVQEKVASESAVASLEKMASDLAAADEHRMHKEAQLYGAAVFDGFISRANQFAANAPTPAASYKTASYDEQYMYKQAAEAGYADAAYAADAMIKEAAASGYHDAEWAINALTHNEKTAAESQALFNEGVLDGLEKVAALSNDCFERGFEHMNTLHAELTR